MFIQTKFISVFRRLCSISVYDHLFFSNRHSLHALTLQADREGELTGFKMSGNDITELVLVL